MGGELKVVYAALDAASAKVTAAADDIQIGSRIRQGAGDAELGSDAVASALSNATAQQVQRSDLVAENVRVAAKFPLQAKRSYQEQDSALAGAAAKQ
ncbi:hypothetical protein GA0004736_1821 [Curtobacterium sp. 9128]|uniref:hypothetical protein n=1 Tax=Curtobacterium sp. 9128 TaxID=1793722 RepID=UPI0007D715DD|nr:hypothetical protein [Curtobacterium sp. 9128]SBN62909.1 hypothetical protein GA0004736_1821 [Curtobacterium sp. 9128]